TFYTRLTEFDRPDGTRTLIPQENVHSFHNDPALTKLSPKPLLVQIGTNKVAFLFWHAGTQAQTQIYYNVNIANTAGEFDEPTWRADRKLPTPGTIAYMSAPSPVYRRNVPALHTDVDAATGALKLGGTDILENAVDVAYSAAIKNRTSLELML